MTRRHGMQERLWDLAEEYLREHPEERTHTADELVFACSTPNRDAIVVRFRYWLQFERGIT